MYKKILILHSLDESTGFLSEFKKSFSDFYISFDSTESSINNAKKQLGDLEDTSLIVYLGHGSSEGLYLPNEDYNYENLFLDIKWGNHFFENHDVILLSCRSNELISRLYKYNSAIGFGNIISSFYELDNHNKNHVKKKKLEEEDIDLFNEIYTRVSILVIKLLVNNIITFKVIYKYYTYFLNKEINKILLETKLKNRLELASLLFELRNQMLYKINGV